MSVLKPIIGWVTLLPVSVLSLTGCATPIVSNTEPPQVAPSQISTTDYETLDGVTARDLLPASLFKEEPYHILDEVTPDGLTYRFTIESSYGRFEPYGEDMLRIRIHEIQALADLETMSQPAAFGLGVASTILSPFKFLWNLITDPKETAASVPKGMWRTMTRVGEMVGGERGNLEGDETNELVGFSMVKRQLGFELGVDTYSSNKPLQEALDEVAMAGYAGGMGSRLALIPITGPAGFAIMGTTFSATMSDLLRENAPEDLRRMNREILEKMAINTTLIEQFLSHPWYSPRHETILVHALAEMEDVKNRGGFLQVALHAKREEEALFYQRLAEMMINYHHTVVPISELVIVQNRLILAYTVDRALAVTVPLFRLPWTQSVAEAADAISSAESAQPRVRRLELWLTGRLTTRTRGELESRGFMIHEQAFNRLLGPPIEKDPDGTTALAVTP